MRFKTALIAIMVFIMSVVVFSGCGGGDDGAQTTENGTRVIEDERRKITIEENNGEEAEGEQEGQEESRKVTIEDENGGQATIEVQDQAPSEEALGAAIYPGSDYIEGTGVSGKTTSGEKELTASGAEFTTTDDAGKVIGWYTGKLGEPMVNLEEEATWMMQNDDGSITTVIVAISEGLTKITIARVGGDIDLAL